LTGAARISNAAERYEDLRAWALSGGGDQAASLGVSVLLHRGVAAWLEIAVSLEPAPAVVCTARASGSAAWEAAPLVACLARMVVTSRRCLA
jgi:hypothetical protein